MVIQVYFELAHVAGKIKLFSIKFWTSSSSIYSSLLIYVLKPITTLVCIEILYYFSICFAMRHVLMLHIVYSDLSNAEELLGVKERKPSAFAEGTERWGGWTPE
jgi:hypothetical protein